MVFVVVWCYLVSFGVVSAYIFTLLDGVFSRELPPKILSLSGLVFWCVLFFLGLVVAVVRVCLVVFPSFFSFFCRRDTAQANRSHALLARFVWSFFSCFFCPSRRCLFLPVSDVRPSVSACFRVRFPAPRVFSWTWALTPSEALFRTLVGRAFGPFCFFLVFVRGVPRASATEKIESD